VGFRSPIFPLACWLAATAVAQEETTAEPKQGRTLTAAQIAQRLEQVKQELLPKVASDKVLHSEEERKKYFAKWQAVTSEHYLLFTNGPTDSCKKYAVTLEEQYARVKKELPFDDLDHLLTCYIFADAEDYYRFSVAISGFTEQGARGTAGHANGQYYVTYYTSPTSSVVFHESTHQIVHACLKVPGVGSWFQEGTAVYFQKKAGNEKPAGEIKNDLKRGDCYPLEKLFAIEVLLSDPNGLRNYRQAGALLDFLINTKLEPVAGKFKEFLAAARQGRGFGRGAEVSAKLIKDVYGLTVPELEALWRKHVGLK